jgi:hypothetical protein
VSAGGGADTIPLGPGTYALSIPPGTTGDGSLEGDLDVAGPLTITHTGLAPAMIDGNGIDRVVHVLPNGEPDCSGLTIRNGMDNAVRSRNSQRGQSQPLGGDLDRE